MTSRELFYAICRRTGGLVTRDKRPLYGTAEDWSTLLVARPSGAPSFASYVIPADPMIFGSLPLDDKGHGHAQRGRATLRLSWTGPAAKLPAIEPTEDPGEISEEGAAALTNVLGMQCPECGAERVARHDRSCGYAFPTIGTE